MMTPVNQLHISVRLTGRPTRVVSDLLDGVSEEGAEDGGVEGLDVALVVVLHRAHHVHQRA